MNENSSIPKNHSTLIRPNLSFDAITFSDGTTINLEMDDIVVFVGPNNAGKSAALRELQELVTKSASKKVIRHAELRRVGTADDLRDFLKANSVMTGTSDERTYLGMGYRLLDRHLFFYEQDDREAVASFFSQRLATETRITDSKAAGSIALHQSPPTHPIHVLMADETVAKNVSEKFHHAFGKDLTVFRAGGSSFPLYVGKKPKSEQNDELSKEFVEEMLATNEPLDSQGDGMRSFATVLLHVIAVKAHSIQFLDEPEAFLHPPQARLLGNYIAKDRNQSSQLFISTHSTDVLEGLIEGGAEKVRIVRIQRDGLVNRIKELGRKNTAEIAKNPLTRFSGVFSGIFFRHVIVCESDGDCLFYSSILHTNTVSGDQRPDVRFVHASGKHRIAQMVETLKFLSVPVSVIVDIDILNEEITLKELVLKLGGNWDKVRVHWEAVAKTLVSQRPILNAIQIKSLIENQIKDIDGIGDFPKTSISAIKQIFKNISPWSALKQNGRSALPGGQTTLHFDKLYEMCKAIGLWIVPVGELEGFCRGIEAPHGPGFVEKVLEERNLETDVELKEARDFMKEIWSSATK